MKVDTVTAANRFGLGARPGDLARIDADPQRWLLQQLQGPSRWPDELAGLPGTPDILKQVAATREMRREAARVDEDPGTDAVQKFGAVLREHYIAQASARYRVAASTDHPYHERLVHFWSNHFAVSADKHPLAAIAGAFENEAIRPNIDGRFVDLLLAVEKHPAMILYLDNQRSIGPDSPLARRARRRSRNVGLNENLAREILELHTLGVDGGYTQSDVAAFARVLTGWSIGGANEHGRHAEGKPGHFEFRDNIHQPGEQRIRGRRYAAGGVEQGEAVLRDLASAAATARHLATKLLRHFVAGDPPPAAIARIADVFLTTGGDLPSVHAALVQSAEAWQPRPGKYKTPQDFLLSSFRAFNHVPDDGRRVIASLDMLGQTPYRPGSPAGWPDTDDYWGGADALYKRIEWSNTVARLAGRRANPLIMAEQVLGPTLGLHTRDALAGAESVEQGLTLLLASPEFQRR